jgi:large repetitive protein
VGAYSNYATILPTSAGFRSKPNNSNSVNFTVTAPVIATNPPAQSAVINQPKTGTASADLAPTGGNGTYTYSVDNSASCTPVAGATALPAGSNLTVTNPTTGAYTYTAPATAGTYYYCIKVCDTSTPTPTCVTKTYTLTVTAAPVPFSASNPPAQTAITNDPKSGTASTDLAPTGGNGTYTYSVDNSASCTPIAGATALPAGSNLTVTNSTTGAYTYTAPATAGIYYYCIKVCDTSTPTANCATKTYKLTVTAPAGCPIGTITPGVK